MRFAMPEALWALLLVPALGALFLAAAALRRRALVRFAGGPAWAERASGQVSAHRRGVKAICLFVALAAGVLALARPQWGSGTESITRKGIDLVIAIDTSKSMDAEDAPPNRLARAVRAAGKLMDELEGDRMALVTFAGSASVACPLTLDHEAIRLFLEGLDTESVSVGGTALAEAAEASIRALGPSESGTGEAKGRAVLFISDGEDHEGGVEAAQRELKRSGVTVFAIGVGTEQGAPIPAGEAGAYKKDRDGKLVTTRLDERPLRTLAVESGGRYYRATSAEGEIAEVAKALSSLDAAGSGTVLRTRWVERYQLPLAVALLALLVETALTDRRKTS